MWVYLSIFIFNVINGLVKKKIKKGFDVYYFFCWLILGIFGWGVGSKC